VREKEDRQDRGKKSGGTQEEQCSSEGTKRSATAPFSKNAIGRKKKKGGEGEYGKKKKIRGKDKSRRNSRTKKI